MLQRRSEEEDELQPQQQEKKSNSNNINANSGGRILFSDDPLDLSNEMPTDYRNWASILSQVLLTKEGGGANGGSGGGGGDFGEAKALAALEGLTLATRARLARAAAGAPRPQVSFVRVLCTAAKPCARSLARRAHSRGVPEPPAPFN